MTQKTYKFLEDIIGLNVEELCFNPRFGQNFKFNDCDKNFKEAQLWAKKFEQFEVDLDFSELFLGNEVNDFFIKILETAKEIEGFDPTSQIRDQRYWKEQISIKLQNNFSNYRTKIAQALSFAELTYKLKKADEILEKFENAKDTTKIKSDLSKYSSELKNELFGEHDKIKTEIFNLKSARATENLSTHFAKHSESYDEQIKNGLRTVFILRIVNYVLPLLGFIGLGLFHWRKGIIDQSFIPIFILFSVAMSLVFHHLKSVTRDLNILKNSKESYEHRAKVGETFVALLASESKDETTKSEMAKQAAIAMFQRVPSGYLTKDQIEPISHPLTEILLKQKITN